ncbi:MAG TPA: cytochrome c, partial [Steroidobacteraceae bacterium]|nr:cytochrome c [Steroidobacteraceae bacterium]
WQLDRPVPARRWRPRLILGLAICGTAFALVSPPGRRALSDWFTTSTTGPAQSAAPEMPIPRMPAAPDSAAVGRALIRPPGTGSVRQGWSPPAPPAPATVATESLPSLETAGNEAPAAAPAAVPYTPIAGVPQTPEMKAANAVATRQGLFLNLSFAAQPLGSMLRRSGPVDFKVIRTSAIRIATLSALISEVFSTDTRPFALNTLALDSIWTDTKDFDARADEMTLAADSLITAAATEDDVAARTAIGRILNACSGCHDHYRRKQESAFTQSRPGRLKSEPVVPIMLAPHER